MSITFYPSNDWKMVERPCTICEVCEKELDPYCTGTCSEPDCPNINMANGNAYAMLELLGLPTDDCCGDVAVDKLPNVRRKIIQLMNVERRREPAVEEPYEYGGEGTGHCKIIYCGRSEDYIMLRLRQLLDLVKYCQENDCGFYWC